MNCCNHNSNDHNCNDKKNHAKGHMSHMWMMVLCCGAPLILLFVISLLGTSFPGIKAALIGALPFICPIMMIGMIPMMFMHGKKKNPFIWTFIIVGVVIVAAIVLNTIR